jgi:tetratricopeptide (TPR) repeat protein
LKQIKLYFITSFFLIFIFLFPLITSAQTNAERVDYLLKQLQEPLDYESQQEIKGAIMRIWEVSNSAELQDKINKIGYFINLQQYQGAEDFLTEIIAEQDDFLDAYYKRAIVHYYQGEIIEAEADLYRTLSLEPRHFDALKVLGLVLEKQNKLSEAKNVYTELHKILPFDESVTEKIQNLENSI